MRKIENVLWGMILIIIGIILGANALGIADINIFFDGWWTLFIIIPAIIGLIKDSSKTGSIIWLTIGVALLLVCQDILDFELLWKLLIPFILLVIGLSLIFKETFNKKINEHMSKLTKNISEDNEYCATFSAQSVNFDDEEFKGAELNAVFGSVKFDLRKSQIKKDQIINACAVFGGIDIYVPKDVKVKIKSTPIFGGVSDKSNSEKNDITLYINAVSIFGGVEIK